MKKLVQILLLFLLLPVLAFAQRIVSASLQ